jgi:hypothetical protein
LAEIRALTRDRDRLLQTQQAVENQLRMILEAYHPAPALFSSVDRQITLSFVQDYPTPAIPRVKATRIAGFLARHHYTGRVLAQVLARADACTPAHRIGGHRRRHELLRPVLRPAAAAAQHPTRRVRRGDRRGRA